AATTVRIHRCGYVFAVQGSQLPDAHDPDCGEGRCRWPPRSPDRTVPVALPKSSSSASGFSALKFAGRRQIASVGIRARLNVFKKTLGAVFDKAPVEPTIISVQLRHQKVERPKVPSSVAKVSPHPSTS